MLALVILALLALPFLRTIFKGLKYLRYAYFDQIPRAKNIFGPPCLPIIGCIHKMPTKLDDIPEFIMRITREATDKGESLLKLVAGPFLVVAVLDYEAVKTLMASSEITKGRDYKFFEKWMGFGLLLGDGERWQKARKMATPAFHFSKLEEYMQTIDFNARVLVDTLKRKTDREMDLYDHIKLCALDTITEAATGVQLNTQHNTDHPYVKAVEQFNRLSSYRSIRTFLRPNFVWWLLGYAAEEKKVVDVLHSFTSKIIEERLRDYNKNTDGVNDVRPNFLDLMLEFKESERLTAKQLREEVDTIIFAGHDTTAHAVSWTVWCLATHPKVQERLYQEIIQSFGDSDSEFCSNKIKELKYLDSVVKEALRLYPPVPAIQRFLNNDLEICGKVIPKWTTVTIPIISIQRHKDVFDDPEKFDPERFAEGKEYPAMSYIPFSAGQRNCIGQKFALLEVKSMLMHLLFNFKIETDRPLEDNKILFEVILRYASQICINCLFAGHRWEFRSD